MGGTGSGGVARRGLVEQAFRLDVAPLVKAAQAHGGKAEAILSCPTGRICEAVDRIGIQIRIGPEAGTMVLRYVAVAWGGAIVPVREVVELVSRPQPFGGRTWYAICPRWGDRVKSLRLPYGGTRFVSRQAAGLAYASTRPSARDRNLVRAQRIRKRLGGDWSLAEPFPDRPRYMRIARYEVLRAKADFALAAHDRVSLPMVQRWLDVIEKRRPTRA